MPLHMRLPKRGFNKPNRKAWAEVNVGRIEKAIAEGKIDAKKPINAEVLIAAGLVRRELDGIRLLAKGELKSKLDVTVAGASKAAIEAVEKAGGKVTVAVAKAAE